MIPGVDLCDPPHSAGRVAVAGTKSRARLGGSSNLVTHHLRHAMTTFRTHPGRSMRTSRILGAASLAAASLLLVPPTLSSAQPSPAPTPTIELSGLAAPFNLALKGGNTYFADGGLNLVGRVKSGGTYKTLAANQPGASGIAFAKNGKTMAFTTTVTNPDTFVNTASGLHIWGPRGKRIYANTLAYETRKNPDKINSYGPRSADPCVTGALGPAYTGQIDSHSYSVTAWAGGWVVADAGSNTLWRISKKGRIKTLAVLPPATVRDHRGGGRVGRPSGLRGGQRRTTSSPFPPTSSWARTATCT